MERDSQQRRPGAIGIARGGIVGGGRVAASAPTVSRRVTESGLRSAARRGAARLLAASLLGLGGLLGATPAGAELERRVVPCGAAACVWDRPRISTPAGWTEDEEWSPRLQQLVLVPAGSGFAQAPARIIVRVFEAAVAADVERLIEQEQDRALGGSLTLTATRGEPLPAAAGAPWPTLDITSRDPAAARQTLAFGRDGESWVVVLLDARDAAEHERALPALRALVGGYRTAPSRAEPLRSVGSAPARAS